MEKPKRSRKASKAKPSSIKSKKGKKQKQVGNIYAVSMDFDMKNYKLPKKHESTFLKNEFKKMNLDPQKSIYNIYQQKKSVQIDRNSKKKSGRKKESVSNRKNKKLRNDKSHRLLEEIVKKQRKKSDVKPSTTNRLNSQRKKSQIKQKKINRTLYIDTEHNLNDPDTLTKALKSKSRLNPTPRRNRQKSKTPRKKTPNTSVPLKKAENKQETIRVERMNTMAFNNSGFIRHSTSSNENPRERIFNLKRETEVDSIINQIRKSFKPSKKQNPSFKTRLEFYELRGLIGRGECGKVYKAIHKLTGSPVAVKSIEKTTIKNYKTMQRVFNEVDLLAKLRHKNIIKLYEIFENQKYYFFIMEFCEMGDLKGLLKKTGKFNEDQLFLILNDLVEALEYMHKEGVFHRDVKLDNILLTKDYKVKLCDFGVSKKIKEKEVLDEKCGTTAYMAPEVIRKNYQPFSADVG